MKARLLDSDRDLDLDVPEPPGSDDLIQDLNLETLWSAMAGGDDVIYNVVRHVSLHGARDERAVIFRQHVLADCTAHPEALRDLYQTAIDGLAAERSVFRGFSNQRPEQAVSRSIKVLALLVDVLRRLRTVADTEGPDFRSEGFAQLFETFVDQLGEDYLAEIESHVTRLGFDHGMLLSARLGRGNEGIEYELRLPREENRTFFNRIALKKPTHSYSIPDRDQAGFSALSDIKDQGLAKVADAVAQSVEHVRSFLMQLRNEIAFYLGCLNLLNRLGELQVAVTTPEPLPAAAHGLDVRGMSDVCLALSTGQAVVPNDVKADGASLILVTGPNQGGKSTFLRSLGAAQLMMRAGMFVAAQTYSASLRSGIYTHFKREEDQTMASGKFDEELARMSAIADHIRPGDMLLCNESFASTNEREGSDIALQIVDALRDRGIHISFVTHMYDLGRALKEDTQRPAVFLRAQRSEDGQRPFRITPGDPQPTSFGEDIYRKVFGRDLSTSTSGAQTATELVKQ